MLTRAGNACTRRACLGEQQCCNRCEGRVVLTASASGPLSYPMPPHLPLGAPPDTRWQCVGDETGQCCSIALDGQPVVVQATLRRGPGEILMLDEAQVCSP
ncbi:hypothetical protein [Polyangium sp. y55x31]|uniref:hypothetical protein n=1 Tax=Polyangium sp. y55x31 TaxID=3042688 RepID=UPI0024822EDF|nr:hypothetical protein [Polyangium sp. y55x31]MDI1479816.1 hypothetical protein [Polyangium sp. y55x31]